MIIYNSPNPSVKIAAWKPERANKMIVEDMDASLMDDRNFFYDISLSLEARLMGLYILAMGGCGITLPFNGYLSIGLDTSQAFNAIKELCDKEHLCYYTLEGARTHEYGFYSHYTNAAAFEEDEDRKQSILDIMRNSVYFINAEAKAAREEAKNG